jgi:hypothetical protein
VQGASGVGRSCVGREGPPTHQDVAAKALTRWFKPAAAPYARVGRMALLATPLRLRSGLVLRHRLAKAATSAGLARSGGFSPADRRRARLPLGALPGPDDSGAGGGATGA